MSNKRKRDKTTYCDRDTARFFASCSEGFGARVISSWWVNDLITTKQAYRYLWEYGKTLRKLGRPLPDLDADGGGK